MKKKKLVYVIVGFLVALGMLPLFSGCSEGRIVYALGDDGEHYYIYASLTNVSEAAFEGICPYYSEETGPVNEPLEGTLPVTTIGTMGFLGCNKLKNIAVPDFITTIGYSAFAYCTNLKSITLPASLKSVPYGIFGGDNSLFYVDIPEGVERIESYAFYFSHLHEIVIPSSVTYLGEGAFYRCDYLTSVEIYADIDTIPYGTFCSCMSLEDVTLPATIKEIKGYDLLNGNGEVISEDDVIHYVYGAENDTENANYEDNVRESIPAFYYGYLDAGSDTITFDYELKNLWFLGTEAELHAVVIGDYNVCLTESSVLTVHCMENGEWKTFDSWRF
ncbi:MAG: leucine-rich repeat domain-containing protein [Clostridia bacterium]|nr:leucine-rich repeat domain-containing protein [Clostridia bacterium]